MERVPVTRGLWCARDRLRCRDAAVSGTGKSFALWHYVLVEDKINENNIVRL